MFVQLAVRRIQLLLALSIGLLCLGTARAQVGAAPDTQTIRVFFSDRASAAQIFLSFEPAMLETDYDKKFHLMQVTPQQLDQVVAAGLDYEVAEPVASGPASRAPARAVAAAAVPGFPCYETVEESFAMASNIAATHPRLADWIDVGDSWERYSGLGGYDMMVLAMTNKDVAGNKPKLFVTCSIHAREYATAPLCLAFARQLVDGYGSDPDATWVLDHREVHLMLHANPDGRKHAENGLFWRKNTNQTVCGPDSNERGVDLNRNFDANWSCCGGSDSVECSPLFHGMSPASEPETQAVQSYMRALFPDQRGPGESEAAPDDAAGVFIDVHSYSELVLWPWGHTANPAPNGAQLRTLGRKLAHWSGYRPQQSVALYPTDGTTGDFAYGNLGVAAYTLEIGTAFFQDCATYYDKILPGNLPALMYAAKVAHTPYLTPSGPNVRDVAIGQNYVAAGTPVELTAVADDTQFNSTNGLEPVQAIQAAEYYIDTPPWAPGAAPPRSMLATDGVMASPTESLLGTIDTTGLSNGQHLVFVRSQDQSGAWGALSSVFVHIGPRACNSDVECDDGLYCNGVETCDPVDRTCAVGGDPCPGRSCAENTASCGCLAAAECDDGVACNGAEVCSAGVCQAGAPINCDDGIACTRESCDEAAARCVYVANSAACDDGNACTADACNVASGCQNQAIPGCGNCLRFDAALSQHVAQGRATSQTTQSCTACWFGCSFPGGCATTTTQFFAAGSGEALGTSGSAVRTLHSQDQGVTWSTSPCAVPNCARDADCQDGGYCNGAERCVGGFCQAGTSVSCDDGVACTVDSCSETTRSCNHAPNNSACDDSNACTTDTCQSNAGCSNAPIPSCNQCASSGSACASNAECCSGTCSRFLFWRLCG